MPAPAPTVAVLVSNPALSSILTTVLASSPRLRVREFESERGLATYARLARVDLLVCDFDSAAAPADRLVERLRADPLMECREFQAIALVGGVKDGLTQASLRAGIDEIIVKPMSSKYLLERVLSRLDRRRSTSLRRRPHPIDPSRLGSNVVPLFGRAPLPSA